MKRLAWLVLFAVVITGAIALVSIAVAASDEQKSPREEHASSLAVSWNRRTIDSAVSLLHSGNVVLRMGMGAQSQLLAQMNRVSKSYSHCGIVLVENGYPFVYHSIGGEDNPDARLRRDSAHRFFSANSNTAIAIVRYDLDTMLERQIVTGFYHDRPRFDMQFDLATDDKLYCTEFVYKVLTKAANDAAYIPVTALGSRRFVGTDNLYVNGHAALVWQVKFM